MWHIFYQGASATGTGYDLNKVKLMKVSGQIFRDKEVNTFRADQGIGDGNLRVLTLAGHVSVYSPKDKANLRCDKLYYDAKKEIYRASGHVSLVNDRYSVTGLSEVLTDSKFSEIATPDLFEAKVAK